MPRRSGLDGNGSSNGNPGFVGKASHGQSRHDVVQGVNGHREHEAAAPPDQPVSDCRDGRDDDHGHPALEDMAQAERDKADARSHGEASGDPRGQSPGHTTPDQLLRHTSSDRHEDPEAAFRRVPRCDQGQVGVTFRGSGTPPPSSHAEPEGQKRRRERHLGRSESADPKGNPLGPGHQRRQAREHQLLSDRMTISLLPRGEAARLHSLGGLQGCIGDEQKAASNKRPSGETHLRELEPAVGHVYRMTRPMPKATKPTKAPSR
jgi:hypothetical protein